MSINVCTRCFNVFEIGLLNEAYCPIKTCEGEIIELDERLYEAFVLFNKKGYPTHASCSGHTFSKIEDFQPYVCFKNEPLISETLDIIRDSQKNINESSQITEYDIDYLLTRLIKRTFKNFQTIMENNNLNLLDMDDFDKAYRIPANWNGENAHSILNVPMFTLRIGINIPVEFYSDCDLYKNNDISSMTKRAELLNEWNVQLLKFASAIMPFNELINDLIRTEEFKVIKLFNLN